MERIKMNALTLCILIFVLVCNFLFSVGISWTKYNFESYFAGYRCVPNETLFERFNVYDLVRCGKICRVTSQCVSFLYQPDNHLCVGCRVYGAIWTGHYDELPGSVYLAHTCDQEYKTVGYVSRRFTIDGSFHIYTIDNLDAKLCTHIIYDIDTFFDLRNNETSKLNPHDEETIKKLQQLKVSNPCLKTLIAVSVESFSMETPLSFLRTYGFNGIDIRDMTMTVGPQNHARQRILNPRLEKMKQTFDMFGYLLTAAVPARKEKTEYEYDVKPLVKHLDFIYVVLNRLGYYFSSFDKTMIMFPLYQSSQVSNGEKLNWNWNAEYWISKGVPKKKLIMGTAAYGHAFKLTKEEDNQIGAPATITSLPLYYEICRMQDKWLGIERWDDEQKSPYCINGTFWVGYNNVRSISEKMYWLKEKGYGGAWIGLTGDDFIQVCKSSSRVYPLLSVMYDILTSG